MKRWIAWILALLLAVMPLLALAEDDPATDPAAGSETTEQPEEQEPDPSPQEPDPSPQEPDPSPTASAQPTASPQPTDPPVIGETLSIDTATVYDGMKTSYGHGYVPTVSGGKAIIVLPLLGNTLGQRIRVTPELSAGGPYVLGNYQFDVLKSTETATDGTAHEVFLIRLELPLSGERMNGTYPIPFTVDYVATDGTQMQQSFTVQLTVTDGKNASSGGGGGSYRETVRKPVLRVEAVQTSPAEIVGGDTASLALTLKNVGNYDARNIRVSVHPETEALQSPGDLSEQFFAQLAVNQKLDVSFDLSVSLGARAGAEPVTVEIAYEDRYGGIYSEQTQVHVVLTQPQVVIAAAEYESIVNGGADLAVTLTLKNTGVRDAEAVQVQYTGQDAAIRHKGAEDFETVGPLKQGGTAKLTFELRALPSAGEGKHSFSFECRYSDAAGSGEYADSYDFPVTVTQRASLGHDDVRLPESMTSGESFSLPICVYNTGFAPIYNVRCTLNCDGLICSSAFMGNLEPQQSAEKTVTVFVTTRSGSQKYGEAYGSFDIVYEDADGTKYYESDSARLRIDEPQAKTDAEKERERQKVEEQQTLSRWWVSVLIGIAIVCILIAAIVIAKFMRMLKMK